MEGIVPPEYQDKWDETGKELEEASIELYRANQRYHEAILARIALREAFRQA